MDAGGADLDGGTLDATLPLDTGNPFDAGDAGAPLDAGAGVDSGASPPDAGPAPGGLPYGAICTRASECQTMLCLGPQGAPSGRCTRPCAINADCFFPDRCVDVPGAGLLCGAQGGGRAAGEPCPGGPTECATGLCVTLNNQPICTQQCSPLPACPATLTCAPIPDGSGGAIPVCVPGSGAGFGETCAGASACASTLCVGVPGSGAGICTSFCDQIPCPIGYVCTAVDDGQGGIAQVCALEGSTGGGFGAACNSAAGCGSGLCLNDARTGGAFCTIPCAADVDCSAIAGLFCVTLVGGQRVCGPP